MHDPLKHICIIVTSAVIIAAGVIVLAAKPRIEIKGPKVVNIVVNEKYEDTGACVYIYNMDITNLLTTICYVDTSKEGTYKVEYSLRFRRKLICATRTVRVLAPN